MTERPNDRVEATLDRLVEAGVSGRIFPGGTAAAAWRGPEGIQVAIGRGGSHDYSQTTRVSHRTLYDLSDLTMPIVSTSALRLAAEQEFSLDLTLEEMLTNLRNADLAQVTLEQLLRHRGGLEEWGGLYLDVPHDPGTPAARRWIMSEAMRRPTRQGPGAEHFSTLGYLLAGECIAKLTGRPLDRILRSEVTEVLELSGDLLYPSSITGTRRGKLTRRIAPTERCEWRGRIVAGEVHDENASALGGVAAHAGLFATASAIARLGITLLDSLAGHNEFLPSETLRSALTPNDGARYSLGWESRPSDGSIGRFFSDETFGYNSRTGCSLWCDPVSGFAIALLSNRTHPSSANERINGFRPAFFDGVIARLRDELGE